MNNNIINVHISESPRSKDTALLFGQFIEHALDCIEGGISDFNNTNADENGIRKDVVDKILPLKPSILRFPGGTIMCQYHWEDAIGPQSKRIWRKNLIWGGELNPSFGTAEFILLCRKIGAEPMKCIGSTTKG